MKTFKLSVGSNIARAYYFTEEKIGTVITNPWEQGDIGYLFAKQMTRETNWDGKQPIEIVK